MIKTVTKNIFKMMDIQGVSAYKLSKETGISESVISRWRSGEQSPSVSSLVKVSHYFQCGLSELMKGD
ncbi:MAG: helix-turn-helix transcriptional regulator [Veillonella sp.]|jgi:DNA-binding helix-turn-helix protein|nr:helix-turn-helix transcriptional regulator [Veillonella sp.]